MHEVGNGAMSDLTAEVLDAFVAGFLAGIEDRREAGDSSAVATVADRGLTWGPCVAKHGE